MNQVCYFQFNSPVLAKQSQFLADLFDWDVKPDGPDHAFFDHHGDEHAVNGDIETTTDDLRTGLIVYWEVEDLAAKCALAVSLGGAVVAPPSDLPNNYGSVALIGDLDGNTLGLYRRPATR